MARRRQSQSRGNLKTNAAPENSAQRAATTREMVCDQHPSKSAHGYVKLDCTTWLCAFAFYRDRLFTRGVSHGLKSKSWNATGVWIYCPIMPHCLKSKMCIQGCKDWTRGRTNALKPLPRNGRICLIATPAQHPISNAMRYPLTHVGACASAAHPGALQQCC